MPGITRLPEPERQLDVSEHLNPAGRLERLRDR